MRRLTNFEREIVETLKSETSIQGIYFRDLYKKISKGKEYENMLFQVNHPDGDFIGGDLVVYYKDADQSLSENDKNVYMRRMKVASKEFFDLLNLIYLLENNGFIYIENGYWDELIGYIPFKSLKNVKYLSYSSILVTTKKGDIYYTRLRTKSIDKKDFNTIINSNIQSSAALEIYIQNGYRTEEQKLNDEAIEHNQITRKQAEEATHIAKISAIQARNAVYTTVILGLLALGYTIYRDYVNDSKETIQKSELKINSNAQAK